MHSVLRFTQIYNLFQNLVGAKRARRIFVREYLQPSPSMRLLDIGCGTAEIRPYLGNVNYTGFDPNPRYIEDAKRLYPVSTFICSRVSGQTLKDHTAFDIIFSMFVVHHLEDNETVELFRLAASKIKDGGRVIVIDPCYAPSQSSIARLILGQDRGQYIRNEEQYRALALKVFTSVTSAVRHDLVHIPYSHCIITCSK